MKYNKMLKEGGRKGPTSNLIHGSINIIYAYTHIHTHTHTQIYYLSNKTKHTLFIK